MTSTFLSGFKSGMILVLMKNPVSTRDRNSSDCVSWLGNVSNTVSERKKKYFCCKCNTENLLACFSTPAQCPQSLNWLQSLGKGDLPYPFSSALSAPVTCSFGPAVTTFVKGVYCASPPSVSWKRGRTWWPSLQSWVPPANHWHVNQHHYVLQHDQS